MLGPSCQYYKKASGAKWRVASRNQFEPGTGVGINAHTQEQRDLLACGRDGCWTPHFSACLTLTSLDINIDPKSEKKSTTGTPGFQEIDTRRILLQRRGSQRDPGEEHRPPQKQEKKSSTRRRTKQERNSASLHNSTCPLRSTPSRSIPRHVPKLEMTPVPS